MNDLMSLLMAMEQPQKTPGFSRLPQEQGAVRQISPLEMFKRRLALMDPMELEAFLRSTQRRGTLDRSGLRRIPMYDEALQQMDYPNSVMMSGNKM